MGAPHRILLPSLGVGNDAAGSSAVFLDIPEEDACRIWPCRMPCTVNWVPGVYPNGRMARFHPMVGAAAADDEVEEDRMDDIWD